MDTRTWTRRRFLQTAGLAGLAPLATPRIAAGAHDWSGDFARALEANPALLGWRSVETDQLQCTARIEGRLPGELQGSFYRNGPAVHERFGLRYRHLFDGDGMVQAFRFDGRGVSHRAHVLATPKLVRETEAGRRLFPGFATPVDDGAPVRRADDINTANISVLDHHGELLALWEGGSASVLDRETLQWQGFKVWGQGLAGLPFTAHPTLDDPRLADDDVGLVDAPTPRPPSAPLPAQSFLHLRGEPLHPAIDRAMVNRDAAFSHHRFEIAVTDRVPTVPTHSPEYDLTVEVTSLEVVHAPSPHPSRRREFTTPPNFATEPPHQQLHYASMY